MGHTKGKLKLCQGDCDGDTHCATGLKCFQRSGTTAIPGCNGKGVINHDYCVKDPFAIQDFGSSAHTKGKLKLCQGDCDSDAHCGTGLICFERSGTTAIPSCNGKGVANHDYCIKETTVQDFGGSAHTKGKLKLCQGDCDGDTHCATGLKCFERSGTTAIPGCTGKGVANHDYCIKENTVQDFGGSAHTKGKLKLCQGDCDGDTHCATGLKCFQRSGT